MHNVDRERLVAALLNDDPEMVRRYHTSAVFRHRIDYLPVMLSALVEGMMAQADDADARARAATAAAQSGPVLTIEDARALFDDANARNVVLWSGVIAVEDQVSGGRFIEAGALDWTLPLWLTLPGQRSGVVRRIWRDGGLIRAGGDCEREGALARLLTETHPMGVGVGITVDGIEVVQHRDRDRELLTIKRGRIGSVDVVEPPAWAAARIRLG